MGGPWMQTRDGHAIELLAPDLSEVTLDELAHSLARIARFTGHTRTMLGYSVAQHSVLVSCHLPPEYALFGLMHDAHEAFLGDISSPVKAALRALGGGFALEELEDGLIAAVRRRFVLRGAETPGAEAAVKRSDLEALVTERRELLGKPPKLWGDFIESHKPWSEMIKAWHPLFAAQRFIQRYEELTADRPTDPRAADAFPENEERAAC